MSGINGWSEHTSQAERDESTRRMRLNDEFTQSLREHIDEVTARREKKEAESKARLAEMTAFAEDLYSGPKVEEVEIPEGWTFPDLDFNLLAD